MVVSWIESVDGIVWRKGFEVERGEGVVRRVIVGREEGVEVGVVDCGEGLVKGVRVVVEGLSEGVGDLVNVGIGKVYGVGVREVDVVGVLMVRDGVDDVGRSVVEGMFEKSDGVIVGVIGVEDIVMGDGDGVDSGFWGILVDGVGIEDGEVCIEEVGDVRGIERCRYGRVREVEVEVVKGYGLGNGWVEGLEGVGEDWMVGILVEGLLYRVGFVYEIGRNEGVGYVVGVYEGIVIDGWFKGLGELGLGDMG